MVDYVDAIKRPFSDWKKLSIGALFYLIPFVSLITGFFGRGYTLECARTAFKEKLPEWKNFGSLFVRGLLVVVIGFVYSLPALIISFVVIGKTVLNKVSLNMTPEALRAALIPAFASIGTQIVLLVLLFLLTGYVVPMALMHYVKNYRFSDAFQLGSVFQKVFTGKYLLTYIVVIVYSVVLSLIAGLLTFITAITIILPYIVSAFLSITLGITSMTMFGQTYKELK